MEGWKGGNANRNRRAAPCRREPCRTAAPVPGFLPRAPGRGTKQTHRPTRRPRHRRPRRARFATPIRLIEPANTYDHDLPLTSLTFRRMRPHAAPRNVPPQLHPPEILPPGAAGACFPFPATHVPLLEPHPQPIPSARVPLLQTRPACAPVEQSHVVLYVPPLAPAPHAVTPDPVPQVPQ